MKGPFSPHVYLCSTGALGVRWYCITMIALWDALRPPVHQRWVAVVTGSAVLLPLFFINSVGNIGYPVLLPVIPGVIVFLRVLTFRRVGPSPWRPPNRILLESTRRERDHIEGVLNTRVNFLVATAALLVTAGTNLKVQSEASFAYGMGACIAAVSLVGIDRACNKLNFYLSWLNTNEAPEFIAFEKGDGLRGLPGAVYACTYGLSVLIVIVFLWLANYFSGSVPISQLEREHPHPTSPERTSTQHFRNSASGAGDDDLYTLPPASCGL